MCLHSILSKFSIYLDGWTCIPMLGGYVLDMGTSKKIKSQSNKIVKYMNSFLHYNLKYISLVLSVISDAL